MSSIKRETILNIVERIDSKEMLLPSMQRKFVWEEKKILKLFDSIMKGYPFGDFIIWNITNREDIKAYKFYQFIKDYSELESTTNSPSGQIGKSRIDIVMDGQQRLTSLYIGLKGSITKRKKYSRKKNSNYVKQSLYFKPHIPVEDSGDEDIQYRFEFLSDEDVDNWNIDKEARDKYYKVSDLYNMTKAELRMYLGVGKIPSDSTNWMNHLNTLRTRINNDTIINTHIISNTNINDVLEIFVRINSGGKELSKSNLLFSTIITSWEDGRDKMDSLIKTVNSDHVIYLKEETLILACIYLINKPSSLKLEILTSQVVSEIKNNWNDIKEAIICTKNFLKEHNLTYELIASYNALLPIMYYCYWTKTEKLSGNVEQEFVKYFVISQLFGLFSGSSATTLDKVRSSLCKNGSLGQIESDFKLSNLFGIDLSANRIHAFKVSQEQIERIINDVKYGDLKAYLIMCLLYPNVKANLGDFDLDHIYSRNELSKFVKGRKKEKHLYLINQRDGIANLQLLDSSVNRGDKKAITLSEWIGKGNTIQYDPYQGQPASAYKIKTQTDFEKYYTGRKELIIKHLCKQLGIKYKK